MDPTHSGIVSLPAFVLWHDVQYRGAYATPHGKVSVEELHAATLAGFGIGSG
jgi:hypothetical protein